MQPVTSEYRSRSGNMKKEQGKEKGKCGKGRETGFGLERFPSGNRSNQSGQKPQQGIESTRGSVGQRLGTHSAARFSAIGPTFRCSFSSFLIPGWQRFCRPLCRYTAAPCKPALATGCIDRRLSHAGLRQWVSGLLPERRASRRAIDLKLEDGHLSLECFGAWKLSMFTMYPLNILGHSVFILFLSFTVL